MKRLTLLLACFILSMGLAIAQTTKVKGIVVDESNEPVAGASVMVKGNNAIGTVTKVDGQFTLDVPTSTKMLIIKYLGMGDQEVAIGPDIRVVLREEDSVLGEVVVLGYGTGRKVGTTIGAPVKVSAEAIREKPTANVMDAMQGKVAGMQVYTSSGEPTASPSVRIHGVGSLGASSTPLYIMDGVPIDAGTVLSLNPNDFESITTLKDASATSIYGARGANGVIYITTKKGVANQDARITVNAQYGVSSLANWDYFDDFMNAKELLDFQLASGIRTKASYDQILKDYPYDTDWARYYYKDDAPTYQGDISLQGGGGKTTYFISGSYFFQDGIAPRSEYERYTFRSNIESRAKDWLKFGLNILGGYDDRQTNPLTGASTQGGLIALQPPFYSPYDKDGNRVDVIIGSTTNNPYYVMEKNPAESNNAQFTGVFFGEIYPIKGMTIRTQYGIDAYDYRESSKRMASYRSNLNNGFAYEAFQRGSTKTFTNTAEYRFSVAERHAVSALIGQEYIDNDNQSFKAQSTGQTDDRLMLLGNGPNERSVSQSLSEYAYLSFFGRGDYSYDGKYFVDFSLRNDQSSRFGKENRSAMFFHGGLMWNIKKEAFMSGADKISELKLSVSSGSSGNSAIGNYDNLATIGTTAPYKGNPGWALGSPGNPQLSWEKQLLSTVRANVEFLKRYRITLEFYNKETTNMLMSVPYPFTSGFSSVRSNVGGFLNKGIDLTLDLDILKHKDYYLNFNATFNYNKNKVTSLFYNMDTWTIANTGITYVVGKTINYYYPLFAGIDPADGLPTWYLPGDDISVPTRDKSKTTKTFNSSTLNQSTGKELYTPIAGGFGIKGGFKGIDVFVDFTYALGKSMINNDRFFTESPWTNVSFNKSRKVLNYWKQPGDITDIPGSGGVYFDDHLLEKASFLRLKALTVSYSLPSSVLKHLGILNGIRVYVTGRNLLTFTEYSGPDPETDSNISMGVYPNTKQYSAGVSINF